MSHFMTRIWLLLTLYSFDQEFSFLFHQSLYKFNLSTKNTGAIMLRVSQLFLRTRHRRRVLGIARWFIN
jgi:hypothetical protein